MESDVLALTKLYGLLSRANDGSLSEASQLLDEKSRLLLKNLLDGAAQQIIKSQLGSQQVLKHVNDVSQINTKDSSTLQKDKQPLVKPPTQITLPAAFERNVSSKSTVSRINCRACEWSGMGEMNLELSRREAENLNNQEQQIRVTGNDFFERKRDNADDLRSNDKPRRSFPSPNWVQKELSIDNWVPGGIGLQGQMESVSRRCKSPKRSMSRTPARWTNSKYTEKVESPTSLANQKSNYVRGLRVPLTRDDVKGSSVQKLRAPKGAYVKSRAPTPPQSVRGMDSDKHDHKLTPNKPRKDLPHRRIISPTLLDHKSGQIMASSQFSDTSSQEKSSTDSNSYNFPRKIMPHDQDYKDTSASSSPYDQTSSSYGESEAYSSTSGTSHNYGKSKGYSSPNWREAGRQVAPISKRMPQMTSDRSHSVYRRHVDRSNTSPKQADADKGKKGLRKVKHMFGFIFHPFHSHGGRDDRDQKDRQVKEKPPKSNWKRAQKMLHSSSNKANAGDNRAIQVSRKTKERVKNPGGNVWGMLVHVRKAKKPKAGGLGGNVGMMSGQNKSVAKKLNYWQKLHNRTKVKNRNPLTLLEH